MKIKILKTLWKLKKTFKKGSIIEVKDDGKGTPLDKYWRNRLKDAPIDGCVVIFTKKMEEKELKEKKLIDDQKKKIEEETKKKDDEKIKTEKTELLKKEKENADTKIKSKEISEKKVIKNNNKKKVDNVN